MSLTNNSKNDFRIYIDIKLRIAVICQIDRNLFKSQSKALFWKRSWGINITDNAAKIISP